MVPTMGALHAGHMKLVEEARSRADTVVVSIFVNPAQFGPNEDFSRYPRQESKDLELLQQAGADVVWLPSIKDIYPDGFATTVHVKGLGERWEGAARPGHFDGVATVVSRLFGLSSPDIAVFGEKDFQQLAVIRRMTADLALAPRIIAVATVRDGDGLALSSRNLYLSGEERKRALALPNALADARVAIVSGVPVGTVLDHARGSLGSAGFDPIDYVALVDSESLEPLDAPAGEMRLIAAATIGTTRLIDNLAVAEQ